MKAFLRLIVAAVVCAGVAGLPVTVVAPGHVDDVRLRASVAPGARPRPAPHTARARLRSRSIVLPLLPVQTSLPDDAPGESDVVPGTFVEPTPRISIADVQLTPLVTSLRGPAAPQLRVPRRLVPFYVSFAALQVLDYHSTVRAIGAGGTEANPVARVLQKQPAAVIAAKAAATAGLVVAGEQLWKRNRAGAVVFVAAMNAGMAIVVAHNYRATRALQRR